MGRPKALLPFGGHTALQIAIRNAVAAGVDEIVTVLGHHAGAIRGAHDFSELGTAFRWLENPQPDGPMLSSLKCGLRGLDPAQLDGFLFQPVDYPLVTPEDLRRLLRAFAIRRDEDRVFQLRFDGRGGHPVLCDTSLREEFLALDHHQDTPRRVLGRHVAVEVASDHAGVLEDMDSPEDYDRLRAAFEARGVD